MATQREIRRRINSVKNISKTTKAMETIAATRLRRAQARVLASRPYAQQLRQLLRSLVAIPLPAGVPVNPLMVKRETVQRVGVINISPDRGLCGSLISNINRMTTNFILDEQQENHSISLVSIGRRGRDFFLRRNRELRAELTPVSPNVTLMDIVPIARVVIDDFTSGYFDEVYISTTDFVNTLTQRPTMTKLLPIEPEAEEGGIGHFERLGGDGVTPPTTHQAQAQEYLFEPDPQTVLEQLLPRFIETQIYQSVLESIASEESARMVAMRNATDNAKEMVTDLTLEFNKARQAGITRELSEISGAVNAMG